MIHSNLDGTRPRTGPKKETRISMISPAPPTYGKLATAKFDKGLVLDCYICNEEHAINQPCTSRPKWAPSAFYEKCFICMGHHAKGHCQFEYLKSILTTPTHCERCDFIHVGFCYEVLYCTVCRQRHNYKDGCERQVNIDLSNNNCAVCGLCHTLHCPQELAKIKTDLILYCNFCKVKHAYMNCTPFCLKCFRHHRMHQCPPAFTFCDDCNRCHEGDTCEKTPKLTKAKNSKREKQFCAEYP